MKIYALPVCFAFLLFKVSFGFSLTTTEYSSTSMALKEDVAYVRRPSAATLQLAQVNSISIVFLAQKLLKSASQLYAEARRVQTLKASKDRRNGPQTIEKTKISQDLTYLYTSASNDQPVYTQLQYYLLARNALLTSALSTTSVNGHEGYFWYILMVAFAMICALAFALFENNRSKQKVNQLLQLQFEEIQLQKERIEAQKASIEEKNRNLELLNATKDKFFSIIAHDLKGPLNTLISFSNLLANDPALMSPQEIKVIAQELNKSVKNTSRLTENLLTWARSQMDNLGFYPASININKVVEDNIGLFQAMAHQKGITLKANLSIDTIIYADESHMRFVLRNLVSNALKFTKIGGIVEVSVQLVDTMVEVAVSDSGLGISEDNINKLFRIDAKHTTLGTAGEKGTGLGLVLCKEFVEKNGGQLQIRSQVGKGSTFVFYVQAANQVTGVFNQSESVPEQ